MAGDVLGKRRGGEVGLLSSPLISVVPCPGPPQAHNLSPANSQRIAPTGRTESKARLASQAATAASCSAPPRAKNSTTSWSSPWWSRAETHWANRHQWPGGVSVRPVGPVLGDDLVLIGEFGAVAHDLLGLAQVAGTGSGAWAAAGPQLPAGVQAEGGDQAPVRGQEALHRSVPLPQELPGSWGPRAGRLTGR